MTVSLKRLVASVFLLTVSLLSSPATLAMAISAPNGAPNLNSPLKNNGYASVHGP